VSWEVASYLLLFAALAVGFAWYERSHPSSKVLALVATLAALAALGRVAFAPLPNVKPTTDIVLLAGFALGGAPGFVVGAVAAVASNLVFGQGPWTPWQMGAWGLVGVFGAALGALSSRRLGRVPLAVACLVAGLGYGAILDFSVWTTFSGSHTLEQYLALSATSLPFNIAHAAGNAVFCLAFGPAFVRALLRFRARFEVRWEPVAPPAAAAAACALLVLVAGGLAAAPAARGADGATARATGYLVRVQNADGGFGGAPGQRSTGSFTGWAALGLAAAGRPPQRVRRSGRSPVDYLAREAPRLRDLGDLERTIVALAAAGASPRRAGGVDLVARLVARRRADGSFGGYVNLTSFGVLALRAAGRPASDRTVRAATRWVARQQNRDGGFNFARRGGASGIDDSAAALQALVAGGRRASARVRRAATFLARAQNPDGGMPLQPGGASNAQSTAWAVQGLLAAGREPERVRSRGSRSPLGYLRTLVAADGSVRYSRTSRQTPVWVTAQTLTALARKPLPIRPPRATRGAGRASAAGSAAGAGRAAPARAAATPVRRPVARRRPSSARAGGPASREADRARAILERAVRRRLAAPVRRAGNLIALLIG
jgi:energy-coupling factor transport system substrate-specific component